MREATGCRYRRKKSSSPTRTTTSTIACTKDKTTDAIIVVCVPGQGIAAKPKEARRLLGGGLHEGG